MRGFGDLLTTVFVFLPSKKWMMKEYDTQEEDVTSMSAEAQAVYGETKQKNTMHHRTSQYIPFGYMPLERFGEFFHEKLDACYAELQGDSKQ